MTIEQLDKIAQIIGNLGQGAKEAFMLYLGYNLAIEILGYAVGIAGIVAAYKAIVLIAEKVSFNFEAINALKELRGILRCGAPGMLVPSEIELILKKVRKLLEKEDQDN